MAWYDNDWLYRVGITVDHTYVDSDLSDFPVAVDLSTLPTGFFSHVADDGGDIRVTTSDGTTECAREIVSIDTTGETGEIHFKAPSLSSSSDTIFYLYYASQSFAADYAVTDTYGRNAVWSDGNYLFVAHLNSGTIPDSTGVNGDSTENGGTASTGPFGAAAAYDGSHNTHWTSTSTLTDGIRSAVTFTALEYADSSWTRSFELQNQIFFLDLAGAGDQGPLVKISGANNVANIASLSTATWHHLSGVFDGSSGTLMAYRDGVLTGTTSGLSSQIDANSSGFDLNLGSDVSSGSGASSFLTGRMKEFRISTDVKTADWIASEKANLLSPSTFYTIGSEESSVTDLSVNTNSTVSLAESNTATKVLNVLINYEQLHASDGLYNTVDEFDFSENFLFGVDSESDFANSFVAIGTTVNKIGFYLGLTGTPTDGVSMKITSSLDGTVLGEGSIGIDDIVAGSVCIVDLESPASLTIGDTYYLQLGRTGDLDASNYYGAAFVSYLQGSDLYSTYPLGTSYLKDDDSWIPIGDYIPNLTLGFVIGYTDMQEFDISLLPYLIDTNTAFFHSGVKII